MATRSVIWLLALAALSAAATAQTFTSWTEGVQEVLRIFNEAGEPKAARKFARLAIAEGKKRFDFSTSEGKLWRRSGQRMLRAIKRGNASEVRIPTTSRVDCRDGRTGCNAGCRVVSTYCASSALVLCVALGVHPAVRLADAVTASSVKIICRAIAASTCVQLAVSCETKCRKCRRRGNGSDPRSQESAGETDWNRPEGCSLRRIDCVRCRPDGTWFNHCNRCDDEVAACANWKRATALVYNCKTSVCSRSPCGDTCPKSQ